MCGRRKYREITVRRPAKPFQSNPETFSMFSNGGNFSYLKLSENSAPKCTNGIMLTILLFIAFSRHATFLRLLKHASFFLLK